jgi:hypothetical protein
VPQAGFSAPQTDPAVSDASKEAVSKPQIATVRGAACDLALKLPAVRLNVDQSFSLSRRVFRLPFASGS